MITQEQKFKILEKLAYYYAEISQANKIYHDGNHNWMMANKFFNLEIEINKEKGERWLLSLIK